MSRSRQKTCDDEGPLPCARVHDYEHFEQHEAAAGPCLRNGDARRKSVRGMIQTMKGLRATGERPDDEEAI